MKRYSVLIVLILLFVFSCNKETELFKYEVKVNASFNEPRLFFTSNGVYFLDKEIYEYYFGKIVNGNRVDLKTFTINNFQSEKNITFDEKYLYLCIAELPHNYVIRRYNYLTNIEDSIIVNSYMTNSYDKFFVDDSFFWIFKSDSIIKINKNTTNVKSATACRIGGYDFWQDEEYFYFFYSVFGGGYNYITNRFNKSSGYVDVIDSAYILCRDEKYLYLQKDSIIKSMEIGDIYYYNNVHNYTNTSNLFYGALNTKYCFYMEYSQINTNDYLIFQKDYQNNKFHAICSTLHGPKSILGLKDNYLYVHDNDGSIGLIKLDLK